MTLVQRFPRNTLTGNAAEDNNNNNNNNNNNKLYFPRFFRTTFTNFDVSFEHNEKQSCVTLLISFLLILNKNRIVSTLK